MSNLRDNLPDKSVDGSKPSTSAFRPKGSIINMKQKIGSPSKSPAKQKNPPASPRQKKPKDSKVVTQTTTNTSIDDMTAQAANINIDTGVVINNETAQSRAPKGKHAKKKENLKKLQLQMPTLPPQGIANIVQSTAPANMIHTQQQVQDFFSKNIGPLYASTTPRYLENLHHHPQYQFMYGAQAQPQLQRRSIPNTPILMQEPRSPQYLNNALQHPLLSKSFSTGGRDPSAITLEKLVASNLVAPQIHPYALLLGQAAAAAAASRQQQEKTKSSPKRNRNRNKNKNKESEPKEEKTFEAYLTPEQVEEGLKNNEFIEGLIRINPKMFTHAYLSGTDRSEQDVLIDGVRNRNRALEGDLVVAKLLPDSDSEDGKENKQKKGKVVFIKEKNHTRTCIGTLKLMPDRNRQKAIFLPRDHRVPRLNIPCTSWPTNFYFEEKRYENTLFLAKILDWTDTRFAVGTISCFIGQSGDMESESRAILAQNDLDVTPFGPNVRDLYPRLDYTIPEEEIKLREDCRKLCIFSIDPHNCRDIDDAVSCRELGNGNYEIGVHISDVAHFLTENTILDEKVSEKATTIYLVEKAYHMLPDDLCMLCSLFPGVDKLAFSVFWEITKDAKVLKHRFAKTVIHSCAQLSYEHAQAVLDDKEDAQKDFPEIYNGFEYSDIHKVIKTLGSISAIFRKNRFDGGALRIDQPKVAFQLSPTNGLPDSYYIYESKQSHQLIEEFMLLANMTVANRIYEDHPTLAFLRCHPEPSLYMLRQLAKALAPMGIDLDITSAGELHRSLLPYVGPDNTDRGKAMVLNMLCAKPMTRAKYFCANGCDDEDFRHYALNVPLYTHFTSPIRRYADIMVHRLLAASLNYRETPKWDVDRVRAIAAQCNKQKYNAKKAGEMSTELYTLKYIEMHSPLVTEAVVVEVKEKYIDVIVVSVGLNRRIFFNNDFPGEYNCIKNDAGAKLSKMELTWNATKTSPAVKQVIEVFSILQVEMHKGDEMVKVETKLVRPT
ncbi:hypothetical protein JYU34_021171 [Plutella xylostella]|uniref:RNB domain-containing protein n=1 Tax=Plutella xylostella TaxID=51655 RepID=A0ABQ7PT53_PLUXY|nr:hypothetical protein JYU34_021171 [Plutella xylostella]